MNEKLLKVLIYIAGVVCLYAFLAIRIPFMFNAVLQEKIIPEYWENTKYGELYYFNYIRHFREKNLPPHSEKYRFSDKHPELDEADIILFGDSFFDFTRLKTFPESLGDELDQRVYYARMDMPLQYLAGSEFRNTDEKILLYESAERYIPIRFTNPHTDSLIVDRRGALRKAVADIRDFIFLSNTELLYHTLLSRNYMTTGIYSFNNTLKFDLFGYMTDMTPKYHLGGKTPWLFYHDQLNGEPSSFYYQHSQQEIDTYCDNIADLSEKLYRHYHLKMVFMAIPSKYTIHHTILNNDPYNNFIPRLYEGLRKRDIPVVPLYEDYAAYDGVLYYGTDTHWNEKGLSIAIENTVQLLDSLNLKNHYYESCIAGRWVWHKDQ